MVVDIIGDNQGWKSKSDPKFKFDFKAELRIERSNCVVSDIALFHRL